MNIQDVLGIDNQTLGVYSIRFKYKKRLYKYDLKTLPL